MSLNNYLQLIRWGRFDTAAQYIRYRQTEVPALRARKYLDAIRVTSCEILNQASSADQKEAIVTVGIGFYHVDSGIVESFQERQVWWYEETSKRWFLEGDLPDFAAAMRAR